EDHARFGALGDGSDRRPLRTVTLCPNLLSLGLFGAVPPGPRLGDLGRRIADAIGRLGAEQPLEQAGTFILLGMGDRRRGKEHGRCERGQCKENHRVSGWESPIARPRLQSTLLALPQYREHFHAWMAILR